MSELTLKQKVDALINHRVKNSEKSELIQRMINSDYVQPVNKIKADAVRQAIEVTNKGDEYGHFVCSIYDLEDYADKLERGEG